MTIGAPTPYAQQGHYEISFQRDFSTESQNHYTMFTCRADIVFTSASEAQWDQGVEELISLIQAGPAWEVLGAQKIVPTYAEVTATEPE